MPSADLSSLTGTVLHVSFGPEVHPKTSIQLLDILGHGGFATVYRAVDLATAHALHPVYYAVKCTRPPSHSDAKAFLARLRMEYVLHQRVSAHPSVVTMHGIQRHGSTFFLVLDYLPGGDLFNFIDDGRCHGEDKLVKDLFLQLLDAVEYCHSKSVYHRDLKPENLILNEDGTSLHLADFGLATPTPTIHGGGGSAEYLSPESFDQEASGRGSAKADVWALGIVLFHMLTGLLPWDIAHDNNANFACFLAHPRDYFARFFAVPADVNALLVRLLAADPAARPALPDIRAAVERLGPLFTPGQRSTTYFHARRGVAVSAADSASGSDEGSFLALTDEEDAGDDGDDEDNGDGDNDDDDDDDDDEDNSSDDVPEDEFPAPSIANVSGAKAHDLTDARSPIEKPAVHRLPLPYGRGSVDLEVKDGILVALPMDRLLL